MSFRMDDTTTPGFIYFGWAAPGTATSDPLWRIARFDEDYTEGLWADANTQFDNVWDDRAALAYS